MKKIEFLFCQNLKLFGQILQPERRSKLNGPEKLLSGIQIKNTVFPKIGSKQTT